MTSLALAPEPDPQPEPVRLYTADDLADLLAVSRTRIYQLRHEGLLPPAIKIGKTIRWDADDVREWLNQQKEKK